MLNSNYNEIFKLKQSERILFFSKSILNLEQEILTVLNFETSRVLTVDFLDLLTCDFPLKNRQKVLHFAQFIIMIAHYDQMLIRIPRNLLAFSALYFSNRLLGDSQTWPLNKKIFYNSKQKKKKQSSQMLTLFLLKHLERLQKNLDPRKNESLLSGSFQFDGQENQSLMFPLKKVKEIAMFLFKSKIY